MARSKLWWGLFGTALVAGAAAVVGFGEWDAPDTTPQVAEPAAMRPLVVVKADVAPPPAQKTVRASDAKQLTTSLEHLLSAPPGKSFAPSGGDLGGMRGRGAGGGGAGLGIGGISAGAGGASVRPMRLSASAGKGGGVAYGGGSMSYGSAAVRGDSGSASFYRSMGMASLGGASSGSVGIRTNSARNGDEERTGEGYHHNGPNPFVTTAEDARSTFAVDVDTASYTIARRKILEGTLPPPDSVRVEEFLNYFRYDLPAPATDPFTVHLDGAPSPFDAGRTLLRVALQGRQVPMSSRKPAHVVFLVDVSGSMQSPDKLPLAKKAMRLLVDNLRDGDTVALVTYAGNTRDVLPPTGLEKKAEIHAAIEGLEAGGGTAMADGITLAYRHAAKTLSPTSISRVVILSDGDANIGATTGAELFKLIEGHAKEGVTLSVCGFGMGNYKDDVMEHLADTGNGNYFYVDSLMQARRVFQEQLGGTLEVIAQDVKVQVEFEPAVVKRYRLVGYENRDVADRDFRNDKVDAGEIGSGHAVTAMYELEFAPGAGARDLGTVRVRAKQPRGTEAREWAFAIGTAHMAPTFAAASTDLRFATAVMGAAEIFRRSPVASGWKLTQVEDIARGASPAGNAERAEFLRLLEKAQAVVGAVATR